MERRRLVKLVRANVAKFLGGDVQVKYEHIPEELYIGELRKKLIEEAVEYALDPSAEELADVIEVAESLRRHDLQITPESFEAVRWAKHRERGGFDAAMGMYLNVAGEHEDDHAEPVVGSTCPECKSRDGFHHDYCSHRNDPNPPARGSLGEVLRPGPN
jgi:predicted house-cleaning noncanonical NTP pyrophosphatase (MazG superfamily)